MNLILLQAPSHYLCLRARRDGWGRHRVTFKELSNGAINVVAFFATEGILDVTALIEKFVLLADQVHALRCRLAEPLEVKR